MRVRTSVEWRRVTLALSGELRRDPLTRFLLPLRHRLVAWIVNHRGFALAVDDVVRLTEIEWLAQWLRDVPGRVDEQFDAVTLWILRIDRP